VTSSSEPARPAAPRGPAASGVSSGAGRVSLEELAGRRGVRPVADLREMTADGVFASDEELDAFVEQVRAWRRSDIA